ncbi:MAG TPA: ATP-binding cassette domain-containing protein, partial [Tepidisphaeraceae bacterium]|nr:ATP-binding cassette domain-containing protein [Tepidisphaeraceae bacterium]
MSTAAAHDNVLEVRNLQVEFRSITGVTQAVRGISFDLRRGKTLAIVGESGSGKSVTSYSILRLIQRPGRITGGSITFYPATGPSVDLAGLRDDD